MRWVVTILLQYGWRYLTPQSETERQIMQINAQANAVPPGSALLVGAAAVFNVAGGFRAAQANCTHRGGPLNEENSTVQR